MRIGKIYLIKCNQEGYITYKIGKTTRNARQRLEELSVANSGKLKVIYEFETSNIDALETSLHRHFDYCRLNGEWFSEELDVNKFMQACEIYDRALQAIA